MLETDQEDPDPQDLSDPDGDIELCNCGQASNGEWVCHFCQEEEVIADDDA